MADKCYDLVICGDCGGTNTRLSLWKIPTGEERKTGQKAPGTLVFSEAFINHDHKSFVAICKAFLEKAGAKGPISSCCLACAGPILDNSVKFTNIESGWQIDGYQLQNELNIPQVLLINDFAAMGYGLLTLQEHEYRVLNDAPRNPKAPIATIGAGTGLGECFMTPTNDSYQCFACEGGHTDFAPVNDIEIELFKFIQKKYNSPNRISAERVISGIGLSDTYEFLSKKHPEKVNSKVHEEWKNAKSLSGAIVGKNSKTDPLCIQAMEIFVSAYGREAGNAALKYLPSGGFYITGGLAPKNLSHFTEKPTFMNAFFDKGRVSKALKVVPVYLVLAEDIGERGVHLVAHQLALEHRKASCVSSTTPSNTCFNNNCQDICTLARFGIVAAVAAICGFAIARKC